MGENNGLLDERYKGSDEGKEMNTHDQSNTPVKKKQAPLYASPWIALFFMLRQELIQARASTPENAGEEFSETRMLAIRP